MILSPCPLSQLSYRAQQVEKKKLTDFPLVVYSEQSALIKSFIKARNYRTSPKRCYKEINMHL